MKIRSPYKEQLIEEAKEIAYDKFFTKPQTDMLIRRVLREYYRQVDTPDIITKYDISKMAAEIWRM